MGAALNLKHHILHVDSWAKERLGIHTIEARPWASDADVQLILEGVYLETETHSWKNLRLTGSSDLATQLLDAEQKKRPTAVFYYYGIGQDQPDQIIGAGTIADKVSHDFPHTGFPVLARSYILPPFRDYRLYFPILKHRFDYCQHFYQDKLRGIHLGTSNPRVYSVIKKNSFGIHFHYMGDEQIPINGAQKTVRDYLWMTPSLLAELKMLTEPTSKMNSAQKSFAEKLNQFLLNQLEPGDFIHILQEADRLTQEMPGGPLSNLAFQQIADLARAIPLLEANDMAIPSPFIKRAS